MSLTIDSHHHFWRSDGHKQAWMTDAHGALIRDFESADLVPELDEAGVDATVLIQSSDEPAENDRLAEYAKHARVAGVVAWLPLRRGTAGLAELDRVAIDKLCGVRCLIGDDDLSWLSDRGSIDLFRSLAARGLAWDVVPITPEQVCRIVELAQAVPDLRIVVDHLGRPPVERGGLEAWTRQLAELAACPSVVMKVSIGVDVLTSWPSWDAGVLAPYVDLACREFGPTRLMLASNWPVVTLKAGYVRVWSDLTELVSRSVPDRQNRADVFGGNAMRWYGLDALPSKESGHERRADSE